MRLTQDLGKSSKIGMAKAHELGKGTWERHNEAHCYRMRASVCKRFLGGQIALVAPEPHIPPASAKLVAVASQ